ncbi:MAG: hypothetical protein JRD93_15590 [Deltaproteobacteria bacterium]|nr:hypothetical protein [Deltaproteobacteria bacterium]
MNHSKANRFQDFFEESKYTLLKNYLYNYRLRKMAVEKSLQHENIKLILEVGSGFRGAKLKICPLVMSFSLYSITRQINLCLDYNTNIAYKCFDFVTNFVSFSGGEICFTGR